MSSTWKAACVALITVAGCSGADRVCDPGATQECVCPGGGSGAQTCGGDGMSWLGCECVAQTPHAAAENATRIAERAALEARAAREAAVVRAGEARAREEAALGDPLEGLDLAPATPLPGRSSLEEIVTSRQPRPSEVANRFVWINPTDELVYKVQVHCSSRAVEAARRATNQLGPARSIICQQDARDPGTLSCRMDTGESVHGTQRTIFAQRVNGEIKLIAFVKEEGIGGSGLTPAILDYVRTATCGVVRDLSDFVH